MELLCVECLINRELFSKDREVSPAVTLIDGTAYCQSHAKNIMEKVVEARRVKGAQERFMRATRDAPPTTD